MKYKIIWDMTRVGLGLLDPDATDNPGFSLSKDE